MSNRRPDRFYNNPLTMSVIAMGAFVLLLLLIFYLGNQLYLIEERLKNAPAAGYGTSGGDSFAIDLADHQTVYVPVYSHIYVADGDAQLLATMLSVRNSDPERPIMINSLRYYGTGGELVQEYLDQPLRLGPLATADFLVGKRDTRGGSGANFILAWSADEPVYEPIVEAVMAGGSGDRSVSFKSFGRPLAERIESP